MKRSELIFTAVLVPLDFIMLILAALAAYFLRFSSYVAGIRPIIFDLSFSYYFKISILVILAWLVVFAFSGLYSSQRSSRLTDEFYRVFSACTIGIMLILAVIFASRELFSSRFIVLTAWFFSILFVFFGRLFIALFQRKLYEKGIGSHNLLVIGEDETARNIIKIFNEKPSFGFKVIGNFQNDDNLLERIADFMKTNKIDEILQGVSDNNKNSSQLVDFCKEFHIVYKYIPNLFETKVTNIEVRDIGGIPIIELKKTPLDGWKKIIKRCFDIIGSLIAIIIFSPIMIAIAIAIKMDSKGPIFFGYQRIGQYGKPFFYFKFRSMIDDAHKMRYDEEFRKSVEDTRGWNDDDPMVKYKNDPRITKVGRFLRNKSLDELPEFFNVLIGRMSLVGPRPHEPEEVARYKKHHKNVLTIKPGITGLSQISGRSDLTFEDEVKLDNYYIENWTLKTDIYILFKTPFILFKKRKAE